ncbi:MAG TPA: VTT domain-containing protein [Dehalococcoidales bacterium]|nr:VTT domain-containing protein [Dehalococcoidales bacterium]
MKFNRDWFKRASKRWEYYVGIAGIVITVALVVGVFCFWEQIRALEHYGYLGAFIISVFGGATVIAPIPMTPVVFALGTVMRPDFAPYMGPIFVGIAAGLGETVGGLSIYMTGYGGGAALDNIREGKIKNAYKRMTRWVERRGSLTLFVVSAVINPFFYPAALAAGALRFGIWRYFFICLLGKTIKGITVAAAGYWGLGSILRAVGIPV